jgi:hypothetical protein
MAITSMVSRLRRVASGTSGHTPPVARCVGGLPAFCLLAAASPRVLPVGSFSFRLRVLNQITSKTDIFPDLFNFVSRNQKTLHSINN